MSKNYMMLCAVSLCCVALMTGCPTTGGGGNNNDNQSNNNVNDNNNNDNDGQNNANNNNDNTIDTTANVRVVHASPDAPAVDACANGAPLFSNATFFTATAYESIQSGEYNGKLILAGAGCDADPVLEGSVIVEQDVDYTVVVLGFLETIEDLTLVDDNTSPEPGFVKVRFVHASPNAPAVDLSVIGGETLFNDIPFMGVGDYITLPAGNYNLQIMDSLGMIQLVPLPFTVLQDGGVYTVWAIGIFLGDPEVQAAITQDN